jgi:hypothetical protein
LQQLVLPIQQVFRDQIVSRETDLARATPVTERQAACLLEPFACQFVDAQIHRIARQKPEHDATVEQPDAAEHPSRDRREWTEQVENEILKAAADRHGSEYNVE